MRVALTVVLVLGLGAISCSEPQQGAELTIERTVYPSGDIRARNHRMVEAETQTCMRGAGFEYVPLDPSPLLTDPPPQFATLKAVDDLPSGAESFGFTRHDTITLGANDPNGALMTGMSDSEQVAWQDQLQGCRRAAIEAINGEWFRAVGPIATAYEELESRIAADSRTIELEREWSECMVALGISEASSIQGLLVALQTRGNEFTASLALPLAESDSVTMDEYHQGWFDRLSDEEQFVTRASLDCFEPLKVRYGMVRDPYDREFALDHPTIPSIPN